MIIKFSKCIDCHPESEYKPLIAKRCHYHYWKHRREINEGKNKNPQLKIKPLKKIASRSKKRQKEDRQYTIKRLQFLAQPGNQRCPITGQMATEIHHMKGRIGDLFLDQKYWLAVSREGHRKIEENPEWAKEMGYSLDRLK